MLADSRQGNLGPNIGLITFKVEAGKPTVGHELYPAARVGKQSGLTTRKRRLWTIGHCPHHKYAVRKLAAVFQGYLYLDEDRTANSAKDLKIKEKSANNHQDSDQKPYQDLLENIGINVIYVHIP